MIREESITFKFDLNQFVEIGVSGEMGHIKSRAESCSHCNQYLGHYKVTDGRAVESWFDEDDIIVVEDDEHPGAPMRLDYCKVNNDIQ
ncbi:hypothetical protein DOX53_18465 [Cronobacter malonaticus]|nr:hypothetical protein [Cronobacter malonaticus]EGT4489685.1 hypothetical protein [Cronobacter malonaticus]